MSSVGQKRSRIDDGDMDYLCKRAANLQVKDLVNRENILACLLDAKRLGVALFDLMKIYIPRSYDKDAHRIRIATACCNVIRVLLENSFEDQDDYNPDHEGYWKGLERDVGIQPASAEDAASVVHTFFKAYATVAKLIQSPSVIPDDFKRCIIMDQLREIYFFLEKPAYVHSDDGEVNKILYHAMRASTTCYEIESYIDRMIKEKKYTPLLRAC